MVLLAIGTLLVMRGWWEVWKPGVYFTPGLVAWYVAIPTRRPFIERAPLAEPEQDGKDKKRG